MKKTYNSIYNAMKNKYGSIFNTVVELITITLYLKETTFHSLHGHTTPLSTHPPPICAPGYI
jgi:hypothetical protein